jgi:hypothetical protein
VRGWHLERTEMLALSLARLDAVFRGAVASGVYNEVVAVLDARARLAKLLPLAGPANPLPSPTKITLAGAYTRF